MKVAAARDKKLHKGEMGWSDRSVHRKALEAPWSPPVIYGVSAILKVERDALGVPHWA